MTTDVRQANRRTLRKLVLVVIGMFGFGYALVPLYNVFCDLTGLRLTDQGRSTVAAVVDEVDKDRWVTVVFTGNAMSGLPWEFKPKQTSIRVHPGEATDAIYVVRNLAAEPIAGQAVPSVTPLKATSHFKKTECFCFTRQELQAGEVMEMPLRFVVDPDLPEDVTTVTLSYAFFNADKVSSKKYAHSESGARREQAAVYASAVNAAPQG